MPGLSFRYRAHPFARARIYRLDDDALTVANGGHERTIRYASFKAIESFSQRFLGGSARYRRHILHAEDGRPIALRAAFRDRWRLNDRSADYDAFIGALEHRITMANPERDFIQGRLLLNRAGGLGGKIVVALMRFVGRTGPDRWADAAAWAIRWIGPRLRGHRRALEQIAIAFPESSPEERERIAVGMWDNLARTVAEYSQLDRLWTDVPAASRVFMDPASEKIWADIKAANRPTIGFSLHLANWELTAIAVARHGFRGLIPYRRMKNEVLTNELVRRRVAAGCTPIAAGPGMVPQIKRDFRAGSILGMLIDQRYAAGIDVTLFGRPVRLNPLFARLARIFECPIYATRVIRMPDRRRFRYEIIGPIEPARDERGRIDVPATTQRLAAIMEDWIRQHPEQWMWLHRLWR
jgi:Kdo2-lipid IVA lauroyltransferase/acyltransferase